MDLYLYYRIYPSASKGVFTEDGGENVAFLLQFRLLYYLGKTQHASFVTYERENEAKISTLLSTCHLSIQVQDQAVATLFFWYISSSQSVYNLGQC